MAILVIRGWKHFDPILVFLTIVATAIGLFFVFDASYAHSLQLDKGVLPAELKTQLFALPAAVLLFLLVAHVREEFWLKRSKILWIVIGLLLLLVPKFGHEINGARRWLALGPINIQPAELAKLAALLYLAGYFATRKPWVGPEHKVKDFWSWLDHVGMVKIRRALPAIWICAAVGIIAVEPDLGTAAVIAAMSFAMFLPGGVTRQSLIVALCFGALGSVVLVKMEPYRLQRIVNHVHRWEKKNVDDLSFQTVQSELQSAIGGVAGVGIGAGRAKYVLPEASSDFIMATVSEEFGLLGSLFVLAVMGALVWRLIWQAARARTSFGRLLLFGLGSWIGIQSTINFMMANASLPAIGIPMPFISAGGSSLVALWVAIGISQSVLAPAATEETEHALASDRWGHGRAYLSRA